MNTDFILTRSEIDALPTVEPSDEEKADSARVDREIEKERKRPRANGGILIPVFE
jgi:hypothetical protein